MEKLENFCIAFQENDTAAIEEGFNSYLKKTISIRDTGTRKEMKENERVRRKHCGWTKRKCTVYDPH
ncbi:MAG: hypothetical protein K2N95_02550 [Lachnospiraceae bacterium]|nr:hypothetical protein [Lachnospiraceae bacterium]